LSTQFIEQRALQYTVTDVDDHELQKGTHPFSRQVVDFSSSEFQSSTQYDLLLSKMVLEHVERPEILHQNVYKSLKKGGYAIHFFATLYSLSSLTNLILPEWLSSKILFYFQKRNPESDGKFPARYKWCLGPGNRNKARFESLGYEVLLYNGYLGHCYLKGFPLLGALEEYYTEALNAWKSPYLTSNAIVILKKV